MKNNWPDNITIQQYLQGELDEKMMHQLEKKALEDPFLADALEGYAHVSEPAHGLSILQRQLQERISHQQENKKVFNLSWQRLSVAAAAAVMFISAGLLFWMNGSEKQSQLNANNKKVEVNLTPAEKIPEIIKQPSVIVKSTEQGKYISANSQKAKKPDVIASAPAVPSAAITATTLPLDSSPALAEVVIAGRTAAEKPAKEISAVQSRKVAPVMMQSFNSEASSTSHPVEGWEAFKKYLAEEAVKFNSIPALKGKVLVLFRVYPEGTLQDFRIISGLSEAYNAEAIRLIKSGPKWTSAPNAPAEVRIEVEF